MDFSYNNLGDEGAKELARALPYTNSLYKLNLCSNNIRHEGA